MTNIKILNLFWPHQTFLNDLSKRLKQFFFKFLTRETNTLENDITDKQDIQKKDAHDYDRGERHD